MVAGRSATANMLAIATGLRQAEVLGLSWSDLDLNTGQLTIRTTLQGINGEFQFLEPKAARSRRTLAFPDMVVDALGAPDNGDAAGRYGVVGIGTGVHDPYGWAIE